MASQDQNETDKFNSLSFLPVFAKPVLGLGPVFRQASTHASPARLDNHQAS